MGVVRISENSEYKWEEKLYKFINFLKTSGKIEDYNQVAFLFRSVRNPKVIKLMESLEARGIPVYSPRSNMFFEREEIKFIIGIFTMIFPNASDIIFKNGYGIENYYEICYKTARNVIKDDEVLINYMKSIRKRFEDNEIEIKSSNFLGIFYSILGTGTKSIKKYLNFSEDHILKNRSTYNLGIFSKILNKFDILCGLENFTKENTDKIVNYFFNTHLKFLVDDRIGEYESMKEYAPEGAVSFLTIHQGKGLEFPCVIVGTLEEYPTVEKNEIQMKLELALTKSFEPEYRVKEFDFWRMYYTAFSRAKNLLALTCVENNFKPVPSLPFKRVYEDLKDIRSRDFELHKLHFEKIKETNIKDIFAFTSHIRIYNICPKLYKLQKKYEFVLPMKKGMIFGTFVHETLEDINRKIFRKENISKDIIKEIFIENYKNIYKKYKMNIDKEVLISGEKSIEEYVKNYPEITENIKDVEVKLSFIKEKYILEGIIDLILEKDGVLEIVDFKTGKKGAEEEGYINQLEIYAYLLKEKYGKEVRKGKLYYLGENKENRITEVYFTKERLSQAVKDFDETAEKIINKDFQCRFNEKSRKCNSCYLKNYCIEEMNDV